MKNTVKFFGIIALVAIIGFSFAACGGGDDGDGPGGGGEPGVTVKNLPSDTKSVDVTICTGDSPDNTGDYITYAAKPRPPFTEPITWASGTFTGTGRFYIEVMTDYSTLDSGSSRWTVADFKNGSGTVDWNTMYTLD